MKGPIRYGIIDTPGWIGPSGEYAPNNQFRAFTTGTHEGTAQRILLCEYEWTPDEVEALNFYEIEDVMYARGWIRVDTMVTWAPRIVSAPQLATMRELRRRFNFCHDIVVVYWGDFDLED